MVNACDCVSEWGILVSMSIHASGLVNGMCRAVCTCVVVFRFGALCVHMCEGYACVWLSDCECR